MASVPLSRRTTAAITWLAWLLWNIAVHFLDKRPSRADLLSWDLFVHAKDLFVEANPLRPSKATTARPKRRLPIRPPSAAPNLSFAAVHDAQRRRDLGACKRRGIVEALKGDMAMSLKSRIYGEQQNSPASFLTFKSTISFSIGRTREGLAQVLTFVTFSAPARLRPGFPLLRIRRQ
jgi:hypothetical protein